jgi:hypothetical protein
MSENPFNSFSTTKPTSGTSDFLESNSLVAKFAFLILVVFGFVLLLKLGISALTYLFKPTMSPHLIDGMVPANQMIVFEQDPSSNGAVTIYRSVNETDGLEFTWSCWIFINSLQTNAGIFKHIFSKGNSDLGDNGMVQPNNAPGLYLAPYTNALVVVMNTFNVINEEIMIPDIPMNKWVNVIIRCENTTLDVYINGTISRSINLTGVPKQNYGDVYVAMNGGFDGNISNLWYYNYALGTNAIQKLVTAGPNTQMVGIGSSAMTSNTNDYLSLRWFFGGAGDGYNPLKPSPSSGGPSAAGPSSAGPSAAAPSAAGPSAAGPSPSSGPGDPS